MQPKQWSISFPRTTSQLDMGAVVPWQKLVCLKQKDFKGLYRDAMAFKFIINQRF